MRIERYSIFLPHRPWRRQFSLCLAVFLCSLATLAQDAAATPTATAIGETAEQIAATATAVAEIEPAEHNVLHRPIELSDDLAHWVDRSYPYGGTQFDSYDVHLGVEFVNSLGTPVYAAKAGKVVFAGDDSETMLGPELDYYGNVVVLAHAIESLAGKQVFTLYGHLDSVAVETGQFVDDLDRIGQIGSTGVAIGPHLHFEVRVHDPFDFRMTRNPELWLQHYVDRGLLAGIVRDGAGNPLYGKRVVVRSEVLNRDVFSYGSDAVDSDPVWGENFTIGDLPAGEYEVIVLNESGAIAFREEIELDAYRTTFLDILVDD